MAETTAPFELIADRARWGRWGARLSAVAAAQADRAPSWLVVCFAIGIAAFFAWPSDPPPAPVIAAAVIAAVPILWWRRADWRTFAAGAMLSVIAGFGVAQVRTWAVDGPILAREIGPVTATGRVAEVQREPGRVRVVLRDLAIEGLAPDRTPHGVRLSVPASHGAPRVGERIDVLVRLRPPHRPEVPGGFQYQRFLYFERIGATGFTLGRWRAVAPDDTATASVRQSLENLRRDVSDRILAVLPGDRGAVTVALTTGEQSLISERLQEAYRAAGLAHLLSISGVHMSLLAAVVFVLVRRALALFPAVALRFDIKKWAAVAALAATFFYLTISGMSVPAVRAFMMVAVVLCAVLLDRRALSLRSVSWAAFLVLVVFPESLIGPSYQMSFMAVIALIALYEHYTARPRWRDEDGQWTVLRAAGVYLAGLVATDLVAGSITSLFAAFHFNNLPVYSLAGNLLAVPITGAWVMPWVLVALALMPLGLDAWALQLAGAGVQAVNTIAVTVAGWPNAQIHVPPMSVAALVAGAAGLLLMCLWRGPWRWLGAAPVLAAVMQPWLAPKPELIVSEDGGVIAVGDLGGRLSLMPGRGDRFTRSVWLERYGRSSDPWPPPDVACDAVGCVMTRGEASVLLAFDPAAAGEDCGRSDVVIAPGFYVRRCGGSRVFDRADFARGGAHAFRFDGGRLRVITVADAIGQRAWNRTGLNTGGTGRPGGPAP
ncbi:MAG: ComEC/Rec2 family competence protein [Rhodospirillaceae bacterium]|nr:ComEC/Rec2 family competence protein [Rhodospirillaceae bacterium]